MLIFSTKAWLALQVTEETIKVPGGIDFGAVAGRKSSYPIVPALVLDEHGQVFDMI